MATNGKITGWCEKSTFTSESYEYVESHKSLCRLDLNRKLNETHARTYLDSNSCLRNYEKNCGCLVYSSTKHSVRLTLWQRRRRRTRGERCGSPCRRRHRRSAAPCWPPADEGAPYCMVCVYCAPLSVQPFPLESLHHFHEIIKNISIILIVCWHAPYEQAPPKHGQPGPGCWPGSGSLWKI